MIRRLLFYLYMDDVLTLVPWWSDVLFFEEDVKHISSNAFTGNASFCPLLAISLSMCTTWLQPTVYFTRSLYTWIYSLAIFSAENLFTFSRPFSIRWL